MQFLEPVSLGVSYKRDNILTACQGNFYSVIAAPFETQLNGEHKMTKPQIFGAYVLFYMIRIPYLGKTDILFYKSILNPVALFLLHKEKNRGTAWYIRKMNVLEAEESGFSDWSCQKLVLYAIWLNV